MLSRKKFIALLSVIFLFSMISIDLFGSGSCCCREKRLFDSPAAFEKIYVNREDVICTPEGIYLKHCDNSLEKVRALLNDCEGMYVLRIHTQCPLCGECYSGKACPEDKSCPLYDKEIFPGIWGSP